MSTAAANAADLLGVVTIPPTVVVDTGFDWTGLYIGAQAGVISGEALVDDVYNFTEGSGLNRYNFSPDFTGFSGGLHIGYNQQFGQFVLGAVSDVNWNSASGEENFYYHDNEYGGGGYNDDEYGSVDLIWDGSTRINAGVAMDRFLPYLTAGIAYGQANHTSFRMFDDGDHNFEGTANLLGYTVGAGLSYAITDNVIVTGEYRYSSYAPTNSFGTEDGTHATGNYEFSMQTHTVQLGASVKF